MQLAIMRGANTRGRLGKSGGRVSEGNTWLSYQRKRPHQAQCGRRRLDAFGMSFLHGGWEVIQNNAQLSFVDKHPLRKIGGEGTFLL